MSRDANIRCFQDTLNHCKNYKKPKIASYTFKGEDLLTCKRYPISPIQVIDQDCVEVAASLVNKGKVCLLNMASAHKRGGGVENGARAQEEHLCRVSNLYESLTYVRYPVNEFMCHLSQQVTVFKTQQEGKYRYRQQPFLIDIVSMAAYRVSNRGLNPQQINGTLTKIRTLLTAAALGGNEIIILSALGCGAYNNPPAVIAELFRQVLIDEGYQTLFKEVIFAIIDDHNSNGNLQAFRKVFG